MLLDLSYCANLLRCGWLAGDVYCNLAQDEGFCHLIFLSGLSARVLCFCKFKSWIKRLQAEHFTSVASFSATLAFAADTNMSLQFTESILANGELLWHTLLMWKRIA